MTDLEFMKDFVKWPRFSAAWSVNVLPIKKYESPRKSPRCAMLVHVSDEVRGQAPGGFHFVDKMLDAPFQKEDLQETTPEKMIADGWLVD